MQSLSTETELKNRFPLAKDVFSLKHKADEIIPIASMSKAIMGLTTALFLYDPSNSYLLEGQSDQTQAESSTGVGVDLENSTRKRAKTTRPESVTIKQILINRREKLKLKIEEEKRATEGEIDAKEKRKHDEKKTLLEKKLKSAEDFLKWAEENNVLANTTIASLLNHNTQISKEELNMDEIPGVLNTKNLIAFMKDKKCFEPSIEKKYRYLNINFRLAEFLMETLTDEDRFFEETRKRVIQPLATKTGKPITIMPHYDVPLENRENFKGYFTFAAPHICSPDGSIYDSEPKNYLSIFADGLCSNINSLDAFFTELTNLCAGRPSALSSSFLEGISGKEIFESFATVQWIKEDKEKNETTTKYSSLGFYITIRKVDGEIKERIFSRDGDIPTHKTQFVQQENENGKILSRELHAHTDEAYLGSINYAKTELVVWDRLLFKLYSESEEDMKKMNEKFFNEKEIEKGKIERIDGESRVDKFGKELKEELKNLKTQPEKLQKDIADDLNEILDMVDGKDSQEKKRTNLNEKIKEAKTKEAETKKTHILELFAGLVSEVVKFKSEVLDIDRQKSNKLTEEPSQQSEETSDESREGKKESDLKKLEALKDVEKYTEETLQSSVVKGILERGSDSKERTEMMEGI